MILIFKFLIIILFPFSDLFVDHFHLCRFYPGQARRHSWGYPVPHWCNRFRNARDTIEYEGAPSWPRLWWRRRSNRRERIPDAWSSWQTESPETNDCLPSKICVRSESSARSEWESWSRPTSSGCAPSFTFTSTAPWIWAPTWTRSCRWSKSAWASLTVRIDDMRYNIGKVGSSDKIFFYTIFCDIIFCVNKLKWFVFRIYCIRLFSL